MSYIGTPPSNAFTSLLKQDFSTSATTGYTLDHAVNNANDIALFINFVRQEPTAGYAASGTSLVLTSATASSDDMYCVYLGQALQTVNPANASVGTSQLVDGAVTGVKASGINTPAFEASLGTDQTIADTAKDKLQINTVSLDTNSCYDNSTNYRFTPTTAGYYFVYCKAYFDDAAGDVRQVIVELHKNGSALARSNLNFDNATTNEAEGGTVVINTTVQMNGSSDYLEVFAEVDTNDGGSCDVQGTQRKTNFGAYKLST